MSDLTRRALTGADQPAVAALVAAADVAVLGRTDFAPEELAADLANEQMHNEGWYDGAGTLTAYTWVKRVGDSAKVQLDLYLRVGADPQAGVDVLAALEAQAVELTGAGGHDHAVLDIGVYRQDGRTRAWLEARDFTVGTTFTRMRIDLTDDDSTVTAPPPAAADAGRVVIRRSERSDDDLRTAHRVDEESFGEHYGHVPQDLATFRRRLLEHGDDWSTLDLAELDGRPVGLLVGTRQFLVDENAGYVRTLGVLPGARGHGVAKALLRHYFADQQRAGRDAVLLHVDVANVTGALGLYESVGMRAVLEIDAWTKTVARAAPVAAG